MSSAKVRIGAVVASLVVAAGMTGMTGMIRAAVSNAAPCVNTPPAPPPATGGAATGAGAGYYPDTTQPGPTIVTVSCNHFPEQTPSAPTPPSSTLTVQTNTGTAPTLPRPPQATPRQPTPPVVNTPQPTYKPLPITIEPVPPPPPVVVPAYPAPAPPAPNVMLTSSVDGGTQALAK